MTTAHICIMLAIIVYLGAMLFVGYLCSKKNNDTSDFYLGGRKLGPLVTVFPVSHIFPASQTPAGPQSDSQSVHTLTGKSWQKKFASIHMWQETLSLYHPFSAIVSETSAGFCSRSELFL